MQTTRKKSARQSKKHKRQIIKTYLPPERHFECIQRMENLAQAYLKEDCNPQFLSRDIMLAYCNAAADIVFHEAGKMVGFVATNERARMWVVDNGKVVQRFQ